MPIYHIFSNLSIYLISAIILRVVTPGIISVFTTKAKIVQTLSNTGFVTSVVGVAATGGEVLAEEGPGLVKTGVSLATDIFKEGK